MSIEQTYAEQRPMSQLAASKRSKLVTMVVSSFTIIKGSLIDETYAVFRDWNYSKSRTENLRRVREDNTIGATSTHWARDVAKVLNRRFDPAGRDRGLADLAKSDRNRDLWERDSTIVYASNVAYGIAGFPASPRANPAASSVMTSSLGWCVPGSGTARFSADRRSLRTASS